MHWDMEGTSGLFHREQAWFWEEGVRPHVAEEGRQLLIADINSATAAALDMGVDEVIVCDTHHGGGNITVEEMTADPRITYLVKSRGYEGDEYKWMPGLNESCDGFLLMGHHAMAGTDGAFMHHTSSSEWADAQLNGQSVGEMGIEACYAGHWGIPVIMAHGDEHACREAEAQFPGIVTSEVKKAVSYDEAAGMDAESARRLTAEKIVEAIENVKAGTVHPFAPSLPMTVTIRMYEAKFVEKVLQKFPTVECIDDVTIRGVVDRLSEVLAWFTGDGTGMKPRK